jgi:glycosyltransferase involved in cell wall biosynthesis
MTVSQIFQPTLPPVSSKFQNDSITLLDRLRHWPDYEMDRQERGSEFNRWVEAVGQRRSVGAPRRVLFVHGQLPGETGSGVYMQQIAAESIRRGIDLYVLSAGYKRLDASDIRGVAQERISTCLFTPSGQPPVPGAVQTPISGMSVVMPYPVLAYRDRTEAELLDFLNVFGNRIIERVHRLQPDVIHVDHLWFLNGLARLAAPWIPLVASAHGTAHKLIVDTPRFRELMVPCVSSADHVCAISPESVTECVEMFEVPEARITIEGYGYEPELFNWRVVDRSRVIREALGCELENLDYLVVSVGKFVDWKGFKELTVAIGLLLAQGLRIAAVIVGEGDPQSREDLETFIAGKGLSDHVLLPGKVARDVLPDIYRSGDIYVLPSHVEPYGMVLMEALACGTPAVAANTGGPPHFVPKELTKDGLAELIEPIKLTPDGQARPQDRAVYAQNLADGMAAILRKKIADRDRMRIAEAMRPLSWGRLVDSLSTIYDRLVTDALAHDGL